MKKYAVYSFFIFSFSALWSMELKRTSQEASKQNEVTNQTFKAQISNLDKPAFEGFQNLAGIRLNSAPKDNTQAITEQQKQQEFAGALCGFLATVKKAEKLTPSQPSGAILQFDPEKLKKFKQALEKVSPSEQNEKSEHPITTHALSKQPYSKWTFLLSYVCTFVGGAGTLWFWQKFGLPPY